jgi:hypothetical protein
MSRECKGCLTASLSVPAMPERYQPGHGRWTELAEFERRTRVCGACEGRVDDTCTHCGCLVNYRAALKDRACPHPGGNRWDPSPGA